MEEKRKIGNALKVAFSMLLGGAILYWMYRGFDFRSLLEVMGSGMNWWWMLLSFPFGILAQAFRGWRWRQTLEPIGERPRRETCVNSVFLSYAVSLVVPRLGEFARCGVLARKDGVSFAKALGTVVTERAIDSLLLMAITSVVILSQMSLFDTFFHHTGFNLRDTLAGFTREGYMVTAVCALAALALVWMLLRRLSVHDRVKTSIWDIWQGVLSLKDVRNMPLFAFYTVGIWASYFLHYYLTFFCFEATASLGLVPALATFAVGSIAVIVPTPNGAGPWHFAVKTMLVLYGVAETDALNFVLIVHTVQTALVVALGAIAWARISLTARKGKTPRFPR